MKRLFLILSILLPFCVKGQNMLDVYNASTSYYQGTAKSMAMGNAMGAVGQDFSAISINPAGLGLYRNSSFVFTPSVFTTYTETEFNGSIASDKKSKLSVNNFGLIGVNDRDENILAYAFGMNRTNNYNNSIYINGYNENNSLIDAYFEEIIANGIYNASMLENYSPSYIYPLYQLYLIDFTADGLMTPVPMGGIQQKKGVNSWGGTNEWTISSSINFNDRVYFGASVNLPFMYSKKLTDYREDFSIDNHSYYWLQQESLSTRGWGINGKLGVIVYPARWIRIGAAFHTPTIYNLTDAWRTETVANLGSESIYTTPTSYFNYSLSTPWRANASAAIIFGNFGMITADYEYTDYRTVRLYSNSYDYGYYNNDIRNTFKPTMNLRFGTEWRYKNMCFRGGYALYGSPLGISEKDLRRDAFSCGLGFTKHHLTIEMAYIYTLQHNEYNLYSQYSAYYDMIDPNLVKENVNFNNLVVSFKFRLF